MGSPLIVPVDNKTFDWPRRVANAINELLRRRITPFETLDADPTDPVPGQAYYNSTLNKARVFDGSMWQDLWP